MVAVISSGDLGLYTSNGSTRGTPGSAGSGQSPDQVYVNTTTGNLVIQNRDEVLASRGLDLALIRTYNSQGLLDDDNGDNWRLNVHQRVYGLTGTLNSSGTVRKVFGDGADVLFTYDSGRSLYVSTDGDGPHDTLSYNASSAQWTWTDGTSSAAETYDSTGRLINARDADGHLVTYGYDGAGLLTSITDASGQVTTLVYASGHLTEISVASGSPSQTQIRTRYYYDSLDRLNQVVVDLTPTTAGVNLQDNDSDGLYDTVNGNNYVTKYTYVGATHQVASITQGDGTSVSFTYDAEGRVETYTDGAGRVTTLTYSSSGGSGGSSSVTANANTSVLQTNGTQTNNTDHDLDSGGLGTTDTFELDTGMLTTGSGGVWADAALLEGTNTAASSPRVAFDANGNGFAVWAQGNNVVARRYTATTDTWGPDVMLDSRNNAASIPALAMDAAGNAFVAWVQSDGTANSVYANYYDAATETWTGAVLQESAGLAVPTAAGSLAVAVMGSHAAVAFLQTDGTRNNLYVSGYWDGGWWGPDLMETSNNAAAQPAVAIDTYNQGNIGVVWQQVNGSQTNMYYNGWSEANGSWTGATEWDSLSSAANDPKAVLAASGDGILMWRQGGNLYVQNYYAAIDEVGPEIILDTLSGAVQSPTLAIDEVTGNAIASWVQSDGTANSVYASIYDAASDTWSAPQLLETSALAVPTATGSISVAIRGSNASVVWLQSDGTQNDVYEAHWDGAEWSDPQLLDIRTNAGSQPSVAIDGQGNVTAVWRQSNGSAESIYQARYTAGTSGPAYYLVQEGDTWQSIANALYGIDSPEAGSALQDAMGDPPLTADSQLTDLPATLLVTVPSYYTIPADASWQSIAAELYGIDSPEAGSALQNVLSDPPLVQGERLTGLPATLTVTTVTTTTVPAYYTVQEGDSWADITLAVYGTANGNAVTALQDALGNPTLETGLQLTMPLTLTYASMSAGIASVSQQTTVEDMLGNITTYVHDSAGRLVSVINPVTSGVTLQTDYEYDDSGNIVAVIEDPAGLNRITTFVYDNGAANGRGNLTRIRDAAGNVIDRTYTATNQLLTETRYLAPASGAGEPSEPTTTRYVYDGEDHLRFVISAEGRVTEHRYFPNSDLLRNGQRSATLTYTAAEYTAAGFTLTNLEAWVTGQSSQSLQRIQRVDYDYDGRGLLTRSTSYERTDASGAGVPADAAVTHYVHDQRGRLLQTIDARGSAPNPLGPDQNQAYATTLTYDGLGRMLTTTEWIASGVTRTTSMTYDDAGNSTTTTINNGSNTLLSTSVFNAAGDVVSITNNGQTSGALNSTSHVYDAAGRLRFVLDATGVRQHVLYDAAGRKIAEVDGDGTLTEHVYDHASRLIKTIRYADRLPAGILFGNANSLVDALGNLNPAVTLADLKAQIGRSTSPNAAVDAITRTVYDPAGRVAFIIDDAGAVTRYTYDGVCRVTDTLQYALPVSIGATVDEVLPEAVAVTVSADDRLTRNFYDADGLLRGTLDGAGYLVEYIYDDAGRLIQQIGYVTPTAEEDRAQGDLGELRPVRDDTITDLSPGQDIVSYFFYDGEGRRVGVLDGEGYFSETRYDSAGNVTDSVRYAQKPSFTEGVSTFDSLLDSLDGTPTQTTSYLYNGAGQVTRETNHEGTITDYEYDGAGNLIRTTVAVGDADDERTTQVRYDELGRVVAELSGEGSKRLAAGDPVAQVWERYGVTYTYDDAGRRISMVTTAYDPTFNQPVGSSQQLKTLYYYDEDSRLRFTVNALGQVTETVYDALGRQIEKIDYAARIATAGLEEGGLVRLSPTLTSRVQQAANVAKDGRVSTSYSYLTGSAQLRQVITSTLEGAQQKSQLNAFGEVAWDFTRMQHTGSTTTQEMVHRYTYDKNGQMTLLQWDPVTAAKPNAIDRTETRKYDAFGRVISVKDQYDNESETRYDRLGRVIVSYDPSDRTHRREYDAFSRLLHTYDADENQTTYQYDDVARTVSVTTPENITVVTKHNRHGQTLSVRDGRSAAERNTVVYTYDDNGRLVGTTDDLSTTLGPLETRAYDSAGRLVTQTDANSVVTRFEYDAANRTLKRIVADGGEAFTTTYEFQDADRIVRTTDPNGSITDTRYDREGRVAEIIVGVGQTDVTTRFYYDDAGNIRMEEKVGDASTPSRVTVYTFDDLGRRITETVLMQGTAPADLLTQYRYDRNGNLVRKIDARGKSTWFIYDANQRLQFTIDAAGGVTKNEYDGEGRITVTTRYATPLAQAVLDDYADDDRVLNPPVTTSPANDRVERFYYDADGRQVYTFNSLREVTQRDYDANGNLTRTVMYGTAVSGTAVPTTADGMAALLDFWNISDNGPGAQDRVTWTVYDKRNRARFSVDGLGGVVRSEYDKAGNLTATTAYAASIAVNNSNGDVTSASSYGALLYTGKSISFDEMMQWAQTTSVSTDVRNRTTRIWYDGANRERFRLDAEGYLTETRYEDAQRRETSIAYANVQTTLMASAAATTATIAQSIAGSGSLVSLSSEKDQSTITRYDAAGRATSVEDDTGRTEFYGYDALGNKIWFTNKRGGAPQVEAYTWRFIYDAAGRLKEERSPLVEVTTVDVQPDGSLGSNGTPEIASIVTRMTYDGLGNVLSRQEGIRRSAAGVENTSRSRTTSYGYDALGRQTTITYPPQDVYNVDSNATTPGVQLSSEVKYDALGNATRSTDVAGNVSYKVYDALGRVAYEIDALKFVTAYTYDTAGNQLTTTRYAAKFNAQPLPAYVNNRIAKSDMDAQVQGYLNGQQDRTITKDYDRLNRVWRVMQPLVYTFDTSDTTAPGNERSYDTARPVTIFKYDAFGQVTRESQLLHGYGANTTNPDANPGAWANTYTYYDRRGLKIAQVDAENYLTRYFYADASGDLTGTVEYANRVAGTPGATPPADPAPGTAATGYDRATEYEYDVLNRRTVERKLGVRFNTSTGGTVTDTITAYFDYDALGNQTRTRTFTAADGWIETYTYYDVLGRVTAIAEPLRNRGDGTYLRPLTQFKRDVYGNVVVQTQFAGGATSTPTLETAPSTTPDDLDRTSYTLFSENGLVTQTQDAEGAQRYAFYNERNELAKESQWVSNPGAPNVAATYEELVTKYEYDALGRQIKTIEPQTASFSVTTEVQYNAFGEIDAKAINRSTGGPWDEVFVYDQAGRVLRTNSGDGVYKVYLYDLAGRATAEIKSPFNGSVSLAATSASAADTNPALLRTETVYDKLGRVLEERLPGYGLPNPQSIPSVHTRLLEGTPILAWSMPADTMLRFELRIDGVDRSSSVTLIGGEFGYEAQLNLSSSIYDGTHNYELKFFSGSIAEPSAVASGTFTKTSSAALSIAAASPHPGSTVGTISISGQYLTWQYAGGESGYADATIQLQQGATILTPTVAFTDDADVRTFTVDLGSLPAGSWQYQVRHLSGGVVVGAATGNITTTGPYNARTISGATTTPGAFPPAAEVISGISASHTGSAVNFKWNAPFDGRISGRLELLIGGSWQAYDAVLAGDESVGFSFQVNGLTPANGTYAYRVTNRYSGQVLAVAEGTLTVNNGNVTYTTALNISPTNDPESAVGTISASGSVLSWSMAGTTTTATIYLQNGATSTSRGVSFFDSAGVRYFSVDLGDLGSGTWTYQVSQVRSGVEVARKEGTFFSSGISTPRQISSAAVTPALGPPASDAVSGVTASNNGSSVTMSWAAPFDARVTATLSLLIGGSWQTYNAVLTGDESTGFRFQVSGLAPPAGSHTYRVTHLYNGQTLVVADGTLSVVWGSSTTATTLSALSQASWVAVGVISAAELNAPPSSVTGVWSAAPAPQVIGYDEGNNPIYGPGWGTGNQVNVSWQDVGSGAMYIVLDYVTGSFSSSNPPYSIGAVGNQKVFVLSGVNGGAALTWPDSVPGDGSYGYGGISSVSRVRVYDNATGRLLRDTAQWIPIGTRLQWAAPADTSYLAQLQYKHVSSSTWTVVNVPRSGGQFLIDLPFLNDGTYDYQVMQYVAGGEGPTNVSTKSGQFVVSGTSAWIASQAGSPACLTTASLSGSDLHWSGARTGGDTLTVTLYNPSNGAVVATLTPQTSNGTNYWASLYGIASGTYTYAIQYSLGGSPYLSGLGTLTVTTATTVIQPSAGVTQPSSTIYAIANVVPTASANSDVLTWSHPALGGVSTTATLTYSINGGAQTSVNFSGPGSFAFSSVTGNQTANIVYTIRYRRNDTNAIYAEGTGTFVFTVSTPTIPGSLSSVTQSNVYPSVPGVTNLQDRGGGLMSWDDAASVGGTSVQVRYRQLPSGGFSSWANASSYGSGYSFNFSALSGSIEYEIRYVVGAQNPYRLAKGTLFVVHTPNVVPASADASPPSSHAEYAIANITAEPAAPNSDVLTWSYPALSGVTTTATMTYSINGGPPSSVIVSAPGGIGFISVMGNQTATIAYTITYRRNDTNAIYAQGNGTFTFTVTDVPNPGVLSGLTQAPMYPSVPGVTNLQDRGGGVMSWDDPATVSGTQVQVRYRQPPESGTWSGWNSASAYGGGYSYNFNALSGDVQYEIRYIVPGQDPYRAATGTVTVNHSSGVTHQAAPLATSGSANPKRTQELDRWGNALHVTNAAQQTTDYLYNQFDQVIEVRSPLIETVGVTTVDAATGSVVRTANDRQTSKNYYDAFGRLVGTLDGNGNLTQAVYNTVGQKIEDIHADDAAYTGGSGMSYTFDAFGQLIETTDAAGYRTRNAYDGAGRLIAVAQENSLGAFSGAATGGIGSLPAFNAAADVVVKKYGYDQAGRRISETTGEAMTDDANAEETIRYWYDGHDNVIRYRSVTGVILTFGYDAKGRKTFEQDGNNATATWTYDYFGHLTGHVDMGGSVYSYDYDTNTWLLETQSSTNADSSIGNQNKAYQYDDANRVLAIVDTGTRVGRTTEYSYDSAGRTIRVRTIVNNLLHEDTRTQYDALDRIQYLSGIGFEILYEYDRAGNRTHIRGTYVAETAGMPNNVQDLWYRYDSRNRVTISQGVNSGGTIFIDTEKTSATDFAQGAILTYDQRGNRARAISLGELMAGGEGEVIERYTYDGLRRLTATDRIIVLNENGVITEVPHNFDTRVYDRASRVLTQSTATWTNGAYSARNQTNVYTDDGKAITQTNRRADNTLESVVRFGGENGYDGAGNLLHYEVEVYNAQGQWQYTSTHDYTYRRGENYLELAHNVSDGSGGRKPGSTLRSYNANGELIKFEDTEDHSRNRYFANNAHGQVLTVVKGDYADDPSGAFGLAVGSREGFFSSYNAGLFFYTNQGQAAGSFGQLEGKLEANFDVNYTPISSQFPGTVPSSYVVQAGDTLRIIAMKLFGDGSLWYILAEANGLTEPDAELAENTTLSIPNEVVSLSNNANSFKPFDMNEALGDTTPTQPLPPPPKKKGGCGVLGMIIVIIVVIVVTVLSYGSGTGWAASLGSAITGGSAAAPAVGMAIAAAAGSVAGQLVGMAMGIQDKFSWESVAIAALTAGITQGVGLDNLAVVGDKVVGADIINMAIRGALSNAVSQGVSIAIGVQEKFSWRDLAISAVSAPVANKLGDAVGKYLDPKFGTLGYTAKFSTNVASGVAGGIGSTVVRMAMGGKVTTESVLADIFGNALGNAIASESVDANLERRTTRVLKKAGYEGGEGDTQQSRLAVKAMLASGKGTDEDVLEIVSREDWKKHSQELDAALGAGITEDVAAERAANFAKQADEVTPPEGPDVVVVTGKMQGPSGQSIIGNTISGGVGITDAFANLYDENRFLAEIGAVGVSALLGGPTKNILKRVGGESSDKLIETGAEAFGKFIGNFVTDLASKNKWTVILSIAGYSGEADAAVIGTAAGGLASALVELGLGAGAGQLADRAKDIRKAIKARGAGKAIKPKVDSATGLMRVGKYDIDSRWLNDKGELTWIDPRDNKVKVLTAADDITVDHVLPQDFIKKMPGFKRLPKDVREALIDDPTNLQPMLRSANSSKGKRVEGGANGWSTWNNQPVDPGRRAELQRTQNEMIERINTAIDNYKRKR